MATWLDIVQCYCALTFSSLYLGVLREIISFGHELNHKSVGPLKNVKNHL